MALVNRSVALVRPKDPYREWMLQSEDASVVDPAFEELRRDPTAYLLPEIDEEEGELQALLEACWPLLFENELAAWLDDESVWPQNRDQPMFERWFSVELASMTVDLCEWPLTRDEGGED